MTLYFGHYFLKTANKSLEFSIWEPTRSHCYCVYIDRLRLSTQIIMVLTLPVEVHFLTMFQVLFILVGDGVVLTVLPPSSTYRQKYSVTSLLRPLISWWRHYHWFPITFNRTCYWQDAACMHNKLAGVCREICALKNGSYQSQIEYKNLPQSWPLAWTRPISLVV